MENRKLKTKRYTPGFEKELYEKWYGRGFFQSRKNEKKPFVIVIPPPNVTGSLHMGHALNNTLQDILVRFHHLLGKNVCWVPGTDHGGIATQTVVEKKLLAEGKRKKEIGRERFLEYMIEWKQKYGGRILDQLKVLGCALDWKRLRFTMDETCSRAVKEAFVRLYEEGKIYRGYRLINYCVRCETSLSDIEVEYKPEKGKLWYIKYPLADEAASSVVVATTRPETMLGDTAVAVNPKDKRYKNLAGKFLILPIIGRKIPIIYDERVEMDFGTGAVKVTPAHDFTDFEIGKTHNLESVKVIDEKGLMTNLAGEEFCGLDRFEARKKVVRSLEEKGLLEKVADYEHSVSTCYRCGQPIEPMLSLQWFLRMREIARPAIEAVKKGEIKFYPPRWKSAFVNFLENIRDWCLSRQIWWGHRLPVYYCEKCFGKSAGKSSPENQNGKIKKGIIVCAEKPSRCPVCGSTDITQENDVLDTWFSSALWPFEVFGWPKEESAGELDYYYPTSVLVTGHEILYLWVARMVMMGMKFVGKIPFADVYIHGIVRDSKGKKMSKSLGNTIDPLDIIEKYGVDSLRYAVAKQAVPGHDLLICDENFVSARNFMNKIWNATNVVLKYGRAHDVDIAEAKSLPDRWILGEFSLLLEETKKNLGKYDISAYARSVYDLFWGKFCDWFLEIAKLEESEFSRKLLYKIFRDILVVMHPVIPFITEEIYSTVRLPGSPESILGNPFPRLSFADGDSREKITEIFELVKGVRSIRSLAKLPASEKVDIFVVTDKNFRKAIEENAFFIKPLAKIGKIGFETKPSGVCSAFATAHLRCLVFIPDFDALERQKENIKKEISEISVYVEKMEKLLSNSKFLANAGEFVIEKKRKTLSEFRKKKDNLEKFIASFENS
ncbi:MAG: valine--tRNA ligase [Elusimicrobia bacterium]|nr:valine--tRNA ligase [Elusimicrobiota bacterium]